MLRSIPVRACFTSTVYQRVHILRCCPVISHCCHVFGFFQKIFPSYPGSLSQGRTIQTVLQSIRLRLKRDGTRAETRFRLSPKRTSPFKSAGASVQSTTGSRVVRISVNNTGYNMFRGSVKGTGYPLHSLVSPSLPLPCITVCQRFSNFFQVGTTFISQNVLRTTLLLGLSNSLGLP